MKTLGARIVVKDIITTLSVEERAKKAGLYAVVDEANRPKCTTGLVVALGTDPFLTEQGLKVGDTVWFDWHSGTHVTDKGEEFRILEWQQILSFEHPTTSDQSATPPAEPA